MLLAPAAPIGRLAMEAPSDKATSRPDRLKHLWQLDIVRLLTFAAVICVHVLAFTEQPDNRVAAAAMMLLQFGREVFFALTGFVLVYSFAGRHLAARPFWRKRILYVAVPYVAWSGIYYAYSVLGPQHLRPSVSGFATDLLYGDAMYHLYFLLVTIQLYLVFPFLLRFVQRTAHASGRILIAVSVANLGWLALVQYTHSPSGPVHWFFLHSYEILPTYGMYVLAGCYAALHIDRMQELLDRHSRQFLAVAAACAVGALGVYAAQLPSMAPRSANAVLQPGMALSCVAAAIVVYTAGTWWAARRRHQRAVEVLSDASFGIYLSHPLVLVLLLDFAGFGNSGQRLPPALATIGAFVVVSGGGAAISLFARRTPLSLVLCGRPWRAAVKRHPIQQTGVCPA
jgi:peptidoglycan/LPS O-acetylase OafA/YrhL